MRRLERCSSSAILLAFAVKSTVSGCRRTTYLTEFRWRFLKVIAPWKGKIKIKNDNSGYLTNKTGTKQIKFIHFSI